MKQNKGYDIHSFHYCIEAYEDVPENETCEKCPHCDLLPKVWKFDNGRSTACGCWNNKYQHFSIFAESIYSVYKRCNNTFEYDFDGLRKNWNHWCKTGEILFEHAGKRTDGRW